MTGAEQMTAALADAKASGRKLLIPYVTGGLHPHWLDSIRAMADAGADAIEIGIPFSDPVMDGPTIQEASTAALAAGATPPSILAALRSADAGVPLVAMTYYNVVFHAGDARFASELAAAGVAGAIVPDLSLEELGPWEEAAHAAGVAPVLLAAPVTPDDRLAEVCRRSQGWVYGVNMMGVTGERDRVAESSRLLAKRMKAITDKPVVMGFGISTPEQAAEVAEEADGVVVASALMRILLDGGDAAAVGDAVAAMRAALDAG